MTSVPPPPGPLDPGGAPAQPEPSQQHAQFAPPGSYPYAGPDSSQQSQPPAVPGQRGPQDQWGQSDQPGPAGGVGQYTPPAQPWGAPQQWQHSQPAPGGGYPTPGQPGQQGPYAPPSQFAQQGQYAPPSPYPQQSPWDAPQPAASRRSKTSVLVFAVVGAVAVLGVGVAAFFVLSSPEVEALPKDVDAVTTAHAQALTVGNCLQSTSGGSEIAEVTVVPCSDTHDAQVVAAKKFSGETFPGDAKVIDRTTAICPGRSITSDSAPESLDFLVWTPSEESWGEGDRQGLCIATSPDSPLTGSLIR